MTFLWENVLMLYQEESEAFQGECVSFGAGAITPKWLEGNMATLLSIFP